jgi:hypothetical protein
MLQPYRDRFNSAFDPIKYQALQARMDRRTRASIQFRIAETPCFFPESLLTEMAETGKLLTHQLVDSAAYRAASARAIPERYNAANENPQPNFMTVDFGLVRAADGTLQPKLVELQAFPSVFGYQDLLCREYIDVYNLNAGLERELRWYLGGHTSESYWKLLGSIVLGKHAPENVVLLEVTPEEQKTLPDFHVYEDRLGIATVDIAKVRREGRKLFYERDGRMIPIERIFNRAIVDEIERKKIELAFDYRNDLDVEWAGHPNWYFRISKFSLPWLDHPSVPKAVFLDDWFRGERGGLPEERERLLLKPLYSFAGLGIRFGPFGDGDSLLHSIPPEERSNYLLQERVSFEPVLRTPFGNTMAEIRILYLWPDRGDLEPVLTLVRMGRGLMMGVDHNRDQQWVGSSAALFV